MAKMPQSNPLLLLELTAHRHEFQMAAMVANSMD